jgi:rubrerythrin
MLNVRLNALKKAMQLEKEGMAYYQAAHDKATSKTGKSMFEYLRVSEETHIKRIRDIYHTLEESEKWPEEPPFPEEGDSAHETIFTQALEELKQTQSLNAGDLDALRKAAEFEERGENYYVEQAKVATDTFEKNFYTQLAEEEFHHLRSIHDTIQMLEDPQGFFADREHGTMSG